MTAITMGQEFDPRRSIYQHTVLGLIALVVLIGGVGGWAATTEISGALIASGSLVVDSDVKKVQHPTGGVVGALNVRNATPFTLAMWLSVSMIRCFGPVLALYRMGWTS